MTWLEIIWWYFWRSLEWRRHENPPGHATRRLPELAPKAEAAWKESM